MSYVPFPLADLPGDLTSLNVGRLGEALAVGLGLYLLLFGTGKLFKYRVGTRLGVIYQLFSAVFAAYSANALLHTGLPFTRELGALASVLGVGVLVRLLDQYFWRWYFEGRRKVPVPKFIREVTGLLLFVVTILLIVQFGYGKPVPGLLAASGVAGIILGFALQDSLGNIIAGFALQFGRPFSVGDWLHIDNQHAQAVEINWRSTRFVTNDLVQLDVPNQQIVRQTIVNYHGGGPVHAMRLEISLDYDAPPNRVKDVLAHAAASADGVLAEPCPTVFLKSFGDSGIVYEVRFWFNDHRFYSNIADAIRTNIWYALRRQRIRIPYPIRTLHLERTKPAAEAAPRDPRELLKAQALFRGMHEAGLALLVERSPVHHYGRGEAIIREKAEGTSMFVLVTGEAAVTVLVDGQPTRVATLKNGDCFGEMSLLTGEKRSASVTAVEDCEVMEVTKRTFGEIIAGDADLLQRLSELLAQRQLATEGIVAARAQQSALLIAKQQEYQAGFLSKLRGFFEL